MTIIQHYKMHLFGAVKLTKNADISKYKYSGYGIGFGRHRSFSHPSSRLGQNVRIFGKDMNSSVHVNNKGKDILILGKGPTQELGEQSLTAGKMYSINFTVSSRKARIIMEKIVIYLLMVQKLLNLKQKILRLLQTHYF